jgi:hypothetical protein
VVVVEKHIMGPQINSIPNIHLKYLNTIWAELDRQHESPLGAKRPEGNSHRSLQRTSVPSAQGEHYSVC